MKEIAEHSLTVIHMTEAPPDEGTGWAFDGDSIGAYTTPRHQAKTYAKMRDLTATGFREGRLSGNPARRARWPSGTRPEAPCWARTRRPRWSIATGAVHGVERALCGRMPPCCRRRER